MFQLRGERRRPERSVAANIDAAEEDDQCHSRRTCRDDRCRSDAGSFLLKVGAAQRPGRAESILRVYRGSRQLTARSSDYGSDFWASR